MQRLRLALSVEALAPGLTGIGRYTWELAQRLPRHHALEEVRFYRSGRWVGDPAEFLLDAVVSGAPKRMFPKKHLLVPRWAREWRMSMACQGKVFHGPNFFVPQCADKAVITVHDLSVFKFPETHPAERVQQFERDFKRSVAQSVQVITDSETSRAEVMAFTGLAADRVTAVPLGVSPDFMPRCAEDVAGQLQKFDLRFGGYALCVSTLEPRKKIEQLLSAWQLLPSALRLAFPLMLAGSLGWLNATLQKKIRSGTAQGWVRYLGYVPEQDLPALYAGAAVFVYPSSYEGFGLPPIEAMACGVPVVVSRHSCLPEVTQHAGLMVEPDDVSAFAAVLERSLTDELWRLQAACVGRKVAGTYTWERCVNETVSVYRRAASD